MRIWLRKLLQRGRRTRNNMVLIILIPGMICIKSCWELDSNTLPARYIESGSKRENQEERIRTTATTTRNAVEHAIIRMCNTRLQKQNKQLYQILTSTRFVNYQRTQTIPLFQIQISKTTYATRDALWVSTEHIASIKRSENKTRKSNIICTCGIAAAYNNSVHLYCSQSSCGRHMCTFAHRLHAICCSGIMLVLLLDECSVC